MIKLYDKVEIIDRGITGEVVDISESGKCVVESDSKEHKEGAYGGDWPLYDCDVSMLKKLNSNHHLTKPIISYNIKQKI